MACAVHFRAHLSRIDSLPLRCQTCRMAPSSGDQACPFTDTRLEAGARLAEAGQVPSQIVLLRRGQVVLSASAGAGRDVSCAVRGPGTLLGLDAVLERELPYEVRALTHVAACSVGAESFKAWMGPLDSPLGVAFRLSLEETARRTGERQAVEGTSVRRVARFLCEATDDGDREAPGIPLGVLASILGMRAETLSRALAELRDRGILAPGRKICVSDPAALRRAAE
jgi:CRP-like cAMP-binding protein